jgi:hypothetical protein
MAAGIWSPKKKTYGRCRNHGGLSTGPRTPEGKERARAAVLKHGRYTREAVEARREARRQMREFKAQAAQIERMLRDREVKARIEAAESAAAAPAVQVVRLLPDREHG